MAKLEIVVATNNEHKLNELRDIFNGYDVALYSLKDKNIEVDPEENGKTYADNAFIKASAVAKLTELPVLSDDSGIEIEALGDHFPGIYSHRYAVENNGQENLNKKLVEEFAGTKARFVCHMVLLNLVKGERLDFEGEMKGLVTNTIEGVNGFGYDPIFIPDGYKVTVASLSPEEKNHVSHRYNAAKKVLTYLVDNKII